MSDTANRGKARKMPTCSVCNQVGHRKDRCPDVDAYQSVTKKARVQSPAERLTGFAALKERSTVYSKLTEINKCLAGAGKQPLAQVSTLGSQSHGKSTIFKKMFDLPLVAGKGLQTTRKLSYVTRKPTKNELAGRQRIYKLDGIEVAESELSDRLAEIQAADKKQIQKEQQTNVEVIYPEAVPLTLVDLPGIISTKDTYGNEPKTSRDIAKAVAGEGGIFLLVHSATEDFANDSALELVESFDTPEIVVVLTKADKVEAEDLEHRIKECASLTSQKPFVTCFDDRDDEKERIYLLNTLGSDADQQTLTGMTGLEKALQEKVDTMLRQQLPGKMNAIRLEIDKVAHYLGALPPEATPGNEESVFLTVATALQHKFGKSLDLVISGAYKAKEEYQRKVNTAIAPNINSADVSSHVKRLRGYLLAEELPQDDMNQLWRDHLQSSLGEHMRDFVMKIKMVVFDGGPGLAAALESMRDQCPKRLYEALREEVQGLSDMFVEKLTRFAGDLLFARKYLVVDEYVGFEKSTESSITKEDRVADYVQGYLTRFCEIQANRISQEVFAFSRTCVGGLAEELIRRLRDGVAQRYPSVSQLVEDQSIQFKRNRLMNTSKDLIKAEQLMMELVNNN